MADRLAEPIRDVSCYHIELEAAHTILAQACIGVLLRLDDHVDKDNIKDFPLAPYAGKYWPRHVELGSVSARIKDGMECFFDEDKPHFATWRWIYRHMPTMRPEKPEAVPLFYAAMLGFRDLAAHIIAEHPEHLEHVNSWDDCGRNAMHVAAEGGYTDIVSLILEHDVDVDIRDKFGMTSLYWASYGGTLSAGKHLLDHGADINARDEDGLTPLFLAALNGHAEFAEMLLERGAVIDARDNRGKTPLQWAVGRGNIEVARLLLKHGADANPRDKSGKTISQCMKRQGILEILSEYGAEFVK